MPYILFSLPLNRPLARFDADASTAVSGPGEKIIPCEEGADPDDVERWRAEAAKPAPEPAPGERLAALREAKREEVLAGADAAVARYMAEFSAVERETWPKQQAEVEAGFARSRPGLVAAEAGLDPQAQCLAARPRLAVSGPQRRPYLRPSSHAYSARFRQRSDSCCSSGSVDPTAGRSCPTR